MTTQGDAPEDGIVSGLSFPSREMWVNLCSSRCVRTRVEKEESVLCVTQQSFSSSISSKNGWHTFRKHSLHPSTSVFFSLCLSASFSLHPSLSASLSSFLPAICLFLFHSWVKGLVSTLCFFFERPAVECTVSRESSTFVKRWTCSVEQWVPLSCLGLSFSVYIHQINAEIKMTPGLSSIPLGI